MRSAKFPCHVFFLPLKLRGPSFVNYIMYVYYSYYIHSVYVYILFFLAVERYWFRQLYHRLHFPPSLERLSKDYTQRWFLSVAQISLKKFSGCLTSMDSTLHRHTVNVENLFVPLQGDSS